MRVGRLRPPASGEQTGCVLGGKHADTRVGRCVRLALSCKRRSEARMLPKFASWAGWLTLQSVAVATTLAVLVLLNLENVTDNDRLTLPMGSGLLAGFGLGLLSFVPWLAIGGWWWLHRRGVDGGRERERAGSRWIGVAV